YASEYYASPAGSGAECSLKKPCKIASFWNRAKPGDVLNLQDGIYTGNDSMIDPPADYSPANGGVCGSLFGGSEGKFVTVRAINDGKAVIDGQWNRQPGRLRCSHYIALEGMRFQNSSGDVIEVRRSTHNILRRISAYNANYYLLPGISCPGVRYYNHHVLNIFSRSTYNVVEDSIFGGSGRNLIDSFGKSNFNIFRRSILVGGGYVRANAIPGCAVAHPQSHGEAAQFYGVSDNVMENIIAFGIGDWQGRLRPKQAGVNIWANTGEEAHRNKYFGTLVMDYPEYGFYHASRCNGTNDSDMCMTESYYENVVSFRNGINFLARNGRNHIIRNSSFLQGGYGNGSSNKIQAGIYTDGAYDSDQSSSWLYENILVADNKGYGCYGERTLSPQNVTFDHALFYGNRGDFFLRCTTTDQNNITQKVNPRLTSLVYVDATSPAHTAGGNGNPVGADLRCRYVSRFDEGRIITERTSLSLWPLPDFINERVKAETLEIHGTAYDVNAKVLDALGPRDKGKLACPVETSAPPARPTELTVR
ncbi:MAG: hypothetical protein R3B95_22375, partial [Nitrospirales bacterium]|nr:hypothetical protein [Nitrospirales bacterium]